MSSKLLISRWFVLKRNACVFVNSVPHNLLMSRSAWSPMVKHTSAYLDLAIIKAPTAPHKGTFYKYHSRKKVDIYETWKSLACVLPSEVRTEYQKKEMVHTRVNTIVIIPRLKCSVFFLLILCLCSNWDNCTQAIYNCVKWPHWVFSLKHRLQTLNGW